MKRFLIPFLLMPTIASAEVEITASRSVGGWTITQHSEKDTGTYTHCTMATTFVARNQKAREEMRGDATALMLKINRENKLIVTLLNTDWKLTKGAQYKLRMEFPSGDWHELGDTADDESAITYILDMNKTSSDLFGLIASQDFVRLLIDGHSLGGFNLVKSRAAMDTLVECHEKNFKPDLPDPTFGGGKKD